MFNFRHQTLPYEEGTTVETIVANLNLGDAEKSQVLQSLSQFLDHYKTTGKDITIEKITLEPSPYLLHLVVRPFFHIEAVFVCSAHGSYLKYGYPIPLSNRRTVFVHLKKPETPKIDEAVDQLLNQSEALPWA